MEDSYDVIVVGAGFGGSACAALLAKNGVRTLLLEKNAQVGGKALTMSKGGFRYELWPVSGGPTLNSQFEAVLRELGMEGEVQLLAPDAAGVLLYKGRSGRYEAQVTPALPRPPEDALSMASWLGLKPDELADVARLFADLTAMPAEQIDELDDVTFAELLARYNPPQPVVSYFGMWSNIVFVVPLDMLAASEAVRTFQDFTRGGAMRYTAGGYGRVAEAFARAVECAGGEVRLRTPVQRILVESGVVAGVRCADATYRAPIVISNAGLQPTVLRLVGEQHFDLGYVSYVKGLAPSWGLMGVRYFLDCPVFRYPVYIAYSDDSYWDAGRFLQAKAGHVPEDVLVFIVVPSLYDPALAPQDGQCVLAATLCSPDPSAAGGPDAELLWCKLEETVERLWPEIASHVEAKERYGTAQVSALTRDQVLPGQGGECIGLGQIVGQCGRHKPSPRAPLRGLYFVGCDAGGYGCGTHQAVDSAVKVAPLVLEEHRARQGES